MFRQPKYSYYMMMSQRDPHQMCIRDSPQAQ